MFKDQLLPAPCMALGLRTVCVSASPSEVEAMEAEASGAGAEAGTSVARSCTVGACRVSHSVSMLTSVSMSAWNSRLNMRSAYTCSNGSRRRRG